MPEDAVMDDTHPPPDKEKSQRAGPKTAALQQKPQQNNNDKRNHQAPSQHHYAYNRIAHVGLDMDDLFDPILDDDNDDDYDDYFVSGSGNKAADKGRAAKSLPSGKKPTHGPPLAKPKSSDAEQTTKRYPQKKKSDKPKKEDNKSTTNYWIDGWYRKDIEKAPKCASPELKYLFFEVWLVHMDPVYALRVPGTWYSNRRKGHDPSRHIAESLLRKELELSCPLFGEKTTTRLTKQANGRPPKNNNHDLSKTLAFFYKKNSKATKVATKQTQPCTFFVDSCARTPALEAEIKEGLRCTVQAQRTTLEEETTLCHERLKEIQRLRRKANADPTLISKTVAARDPWSNQAHLVGKLSLKEAWEERLERAQIVLESLNAGPELGDAGRASIIDVLAWHGIELRLSEQSEGNKEEAGSVNDGDNNRNNSKKEDKKKQKTLLRQILNHGATQFERTVWIQSPNYGFKAGNKILTVPPERRLLAMDRHRCYFFQFCPTQPKMLDRQSYAAQSYNVNGGLRQYAESPFQQGIHL